MYEARFGRLERRFLRRTLRLPHPARIWARSSALAAQEMDHWLFLNPGSLFREQLAALSPAQGRSIFLLWFSAGLAALHSVPDLPRPDPVQLEAIHRLAAEFEPDAAASPRALVPVFAALEGQPALRPALLSALASILPAPPDLEQGLTFGILAGQMLDGAVARCRRLL